MISLYFDDDPSKSSQLSGKNTLMNLEKANTQLSHVHEAQVIKNFFIFDLFIYFYLTRESHIDIKNLFCNWALATRSTHKNQKNNRQGDNNNTTTTQQQQNQIKLKKNKENDTIL